MFNAFQSQIDNAPNKVKENSLRRKLNHLLHTNPDYHFGKGLKEFRSNASTVFILALCAPILSQIILHPVMDKIFGKKGTPQQKTSNKQINKQA